MLYHLFRYLFEGRHYAYENPVFRATVAVLLCFGLVFALMPMTIRRLIKWKIGDRADFDHASLNELTQNKKNVPTMGGVLILTAIASAILLLGDLYNFYIQLSLVCLVWLGLLGAVDDYLKLTAIRRGGSRDGLKAYEKILFQLALAMVVGYYAYRYGSHNDAVIAKTGGETLLPAYRVLSVPFYKDGLLLGPIAFMILSIIVMTGSSNAVNLTDGMDGLAAGCVAICVLVFGILTQVVGVEATAAKLLFPHIPRSDELGVVCGAMLGACMGFLWYNCYPAKVFMGDTGSLPLGGLIGYIAIVLRQELMLLIVGGVFVLEAVSVILQVGYFRSTGGKRIFRCAPLHHHFHLGGWTEPQTVVRFWLIAAFFAGCALITIKLR